MRPVRLVGKFQRVLAYAIAQRRALVVVFVLSLGGAALAALQPWPLKILVDFGLSGAALPDLLAGGFALAGLTPSPLAIVAVAASASILLFVLTTALEAATTFAWATAGQRMVYGLATDLFLQLQRLSLRFHA